MHKGNYFLGWAAYAHLHKVNRCFVTFHGLHKRKKDISVNEWILDSGGFSWQVKGIAYPDTPTEYAEKIERWSHCGRLLGAVSQDIMPVSGASMDECHTRTIENYVELRQAARKLTPDVHILPAIQGTWPHEYADHVKQYGKLLPQGCWVCVGSIVPHSSNYPRLVATFRAIKEVRPDLRIHGLGLKIAAIKQQRVRDFLYTADSCGWTFGFMQELQCTLAEYRQGLRPKKNTMDGQLEYIGRYLKELDSYCDEPTEPIHDCGKFLSAMRGEV